jgi:hypothetical protein
MNKLKSLTFDEYKVDAKGVLNEAIEEEPDTVIIFIFHKGTGAFKIKTSAIEDRMKLIGALEEAKHGILLKGILG